MWNSFARILRQAADDAGIDLKVYPNSILENNTTTRNHFLDDCKGADVILLYRTVHSFWDEIEPEIRNLRAIKPIICIGHDPALWGLSNVPGSVTATVYAYLTHNGEQNMQNLLKYIRREVLGIDGEVSPPKDLPWQGIWHPDASRCFLSIDEYLTWYENRRIKGAPFIGVLFPRMAWATGACEIETALIRSMEGLNLNVIPCFAYSVQDEGLGAWSMIDVIRTYLMSDSQPRISALVKLTPFLLGAGRRNFYGAGPAHAGVEFLTSLNIPVFQPIILHRMTVDEWRASEGIGNDIGWSVALPEFEGVIEPVFIGSSAFSENGDEGREVVPDRYEKIARRVRNWALLAQKPTAERKIAFILNNNPCTSVEGNVGGAAKLDSLESVARIMQGMAASGYSVTPPSDGKDLVSAILDHKAISEFRWTSMPEILAKKGALAILGEKEYGPMFEALSPSARERVRSVWGDPPGQGMVHQGNIVVTGLRYGNAVVCVQPKRGCFGSRCDGEICKILHDPECPPPYQYIATYRYLTDIYGADVIVHVGTHGNLEFLPGKGIGLSQDCFPDVVIGDVPYLYIYNSDNPPEGTIAKRRSYAVLVDHMQTVMTQGGLYDELEDLDRLLGEYETAKTDPSRSHALSHMIRDAITAAKLDKDLHLTQDMPLGDLVVKAHEVLSRIRNTQVQQGLHIFGTVPTGDKRADMIRSIIRFDSGEKSLRYLFARELGLDLSGLLMNQGEVSVKYRVSNGVLLERIDAMIRDYVNAVIRGGECSPGKQEMSDLNVVSAHELSVHTERIQEINRLIDGSDEIGSLLKGLSGGYIPSGPSGVITRGREDILPTGRNFYSLDPDRVPTRSAWRVGQRLADKMIGKYLDEQQAIPENVAFFWMAGDLMYADGEMLAQMLALLGVEPVWGRNGRVEAFQVIPLDRLNRPRIDITVRSSGILRDNFSTRITLLDDAVTAVAGLDEPCELNFIRKHSLQSMEDNNSSWRDATIRVFSSQPGTYSSGVNLAVMASAWKDEKDLADIFVAYNGYGYGRGIAGQSAQTQLSTSLATVDITFNKVATDEKDLLGCCCHFSTQGGLTVAARQYSGHEVKSYYGDTREADNIEVRYLADEIRRVVRTKLLNPRWIEGMKEHGYKGASDIMKRVSRVYGWEASTQEVDDWIFDDIAGTFILDTGMKKFFEENNPYALEEITRRLLEAQQRGLWNADPGVIEKLRTTYLEIEGWLEEDRGDAAGATQGGAVDVFTPEDVAAWKKTMDRMMHEKSR